VTTASLPSWSCPSCGGAEAPDSPFCRHCGERRLTPRDRSLAGLFWQLVDSVLHVDGRVVRTVALLFRAPGALTVAFRDGRRRPFVGPFALFLAVNVVFFVVQGVSGLSILSTPLRVQTDGMVYSALTRPLVEAKVARRGVPADTYAQTFDQREPTIAKTLVIAMAPLLALVAALLFAGRGESAVTHLVFALHFYTYMLLALTVLFPVLALGLFGARLLGIVPAWSAVDDAVTLVELSLVVFYFARAAPRVYGRGLTFNVFAVAVLTAAVPGLFILYRLVVFGVAFAAT